MGKSKTDCQFYLYESDKNGCIALNQLYCKIEEKECKFYKKKDTDVLPEQLKKEN